MVRVGLVLVSFASVCAHAQPRVGVIALGPDAETAGALQLRMEQALSAQPGIEVVRIIELAPKLSIGPAVAPDDPQLATLVALAKTAYTEDRPLDAFHRLSEAAAMIEAGKSQPGADKEFVLLLRAAVYHAMGDATLAEKEVSELLALAPDVAPDPKVYRPAFVSFLDKMRSNHSSVQVTLNGIPLNARVEVDGRLVGTTFRVGPGAHTVSVAAAGIRPIRTRIEASRDSKVALFPAFDLGDKVRTSLEAAVWSSPPDDSLSVIGKRAGPIHLLIVAPRAGDGALRGAFRRSDGLITRSEISAGQNPDLVIATWAGKQSPPRNATAKATRPSDARKPEHPVAAPRDNRRQGTTVSSGLSFQQRTRSLKGKNGTGFDASFAGAGAFAEGALGIGKWRARARASYVSYDFSKATFDVPGGSEASVLGGNSIRIDAGGGRHLVGDPGGPFALSGSLCATWETHRAQDLQSDQGDLGLFASYQRIAAGGAVGLSGKVGALEWNGTAEILPIHQWSESPRKTGDSAQGMPVFGIGGGITTPLGPVRMDVRYSFEHRGARFDGTADAPTDPAIVNGLQVESIHTISAAVVKRF